MNKNLHTMTRARFPESMAIYHFQLKDGTKISVITDYNRFYGELISRFQIDNKTETEVDCIYPELGKIQFEESSNLIGVRPFEKNSITYEYLLKPLGIDTTNYPATGKDRWKILYTSFSEFRMAMNRMEATMF